MVLVSESRGGDRRQFDLAAAFPCALRTAATTAALVIPAATLTSPEAFVVALDNETVAIPYRIYNAEPATDPTRELSPVERTVLACVYTRHHDGYVRQRYLAEILAHPRPWTAPFVVQLLGEYVLPIVEQIQRGLAGTETPGTALYTVYGHFAAANPAFITLTRQRAASYWDCYHRSRYTLRAYPASKVLDALQAAAGDAARRIPPSP